MKLQEIRSTTNIKDLLPAIKYLCDNMHEMPWGTFSAYKRVLESQSEKLGISYKKLNNIAENYQVFGVLADKE